MQAVILESFVGSSYDDSATSYEFPRRYLRQFEPLAHGESMVAVIYEPRGVQGTGRMAYVGLVTLTEPPVLSIRRGSRDQPLWVVRYSGRYREFDRVVPRTIGGEPVETWLREIPPGRPRNVATFGRAVRPLSAQDLETIVRFGFAGELDLGSSYPLGDSHEQQHLEVHERMAVLVSAAQREARFRDDVQIAYERRCAVTGFSTGARSPSLIHGLLDAAHIRPVWAQGPDDVINGLALTPTVHRLFDKGMFTLDYQEGVPIVVVSARLESSMIRSPDGSSVLALATGRPLYLPGDRRLWPHPEALQYHRREVFVGN